MFITASSSVYFDTGAVTKWKIAFLNERVHLVVLESLNRAAYKDRCGLAESSRLSL